MYSVLKERLSRFPVLLDAYENATLIEKGELLQLFFWPEPESLFYLKSKQPKNNTESETFRSEGNQLFSNKENEKTLEMYNKSICHAETGSEHLGIAYANRSAVHFSMGLYDECLKSIDLAKQSNYPENLMPKLLEREQACLNSLEKNENPCISQRKDFKLTYPANERIPGIVDCVELKKSQKYGKGLYVTKEIHAGDVLINEEACVSSLVKGEIYKRCSRCLNENHLNLIPCEFCTRAMFCSPECKKMAWEDFHRLECEITNGKMELDSTCMYALRILFIAMKAFNNSVDEWINYFEKTNREKIHNLKIDHKKLTMKNRYKAILGLCPKYIDDGDLCTTVVKACALRTLILDDPNMKQYFELELHKQFLYRMLFLNCLVSETHGSSIIGLMTSNFYETFKGEKQPTIATGLFSITSLMNHSCANNVELISVKRRVIGYAIRNIKKGDQLFISYGPNFVFDEKNERQEKLKELYGFECDCEACINNYPVMTSMQSPMYNLSDEAIAHRFEYLDQNGQDFATFQQVILRQEILATYTANLQEYD